MSSLHLRWLAFCVLLPSTEGYVVCEEYKEMLVEAWANEEVAREKKEKEVSIAFIGAGFLGIQIP